jgi:hypothetical protein
MRAEAQSLVESHVLPKFLNSPWAPVVAIFLLNTKEATLK